MIRRKEFVATTLDPEDKSFVVYPAFFAISNDDVYPSYKAQIASLKANETFTTVLPKYSNFTNIFSSELVAELPKHMKINNYAIGLINVKQLPYEPIYSLGPVKLENLKTCDEINQSNSFIKSSKSLTSTLILFDQKLDGSYCLCMDY